MTKWLQRIRGAIGMGLTWAAGWVPVAAVTGLITGVVIGLFPLGRIAANYALMFGVLGFVGGTIFSTVLSIAGAVAGSPSCRCRDSSHGEPWEASCSGASASAQGSLGQA